jgi:hypothetical protein
LAFTALDYFHFHISPGNRSLDALRPLRVKRKKYTKSGRSKSGSKQATEENGGEDGLGIVTLNNTMANAGLDADGHVIVGDGEIAAAGSNGSVNVNVNGGVVNGAPANADSAIRNVAVLKNNAESRSNNDNDSTGGDVVNTRGNQNSNGTGRVNGTNAATNANVANGDTLTTAQQNQILWEAFLKENGTAAAGILSRRESSACSVAVGGGSIADIQDFLDDEDFVLDLQDPLFEAFRSASTL